MFEWNGKIAPDGFLHKRLAITQERRALAPGTAVKLYFLAVKDTEPEIFRASSILSYAILLGGVLTIGIALYMVVVSYSGLPFADGWMEVQVAAGGGNLLSPAWLWERDNEHRVVIPKLFQAADMRLFQGRQIFLLASIFGIQLLHLALLSWSMQVLGGWRGALWRTGTGLAAFCLFCPIQWPNFVWGWQVCFVLPQLLATVSFVALLLYWTKSQQDPEKLWLTFLMVSILAAVGAAYSLASGNLLWPILILAALYLRLRRAAVLSYAIAAVVSTGLYFYRLNLSSRWEHPENTIASKLVSPLTSVRYFARLFIGSVTDRGTHAAEFVLLAVLVIVVIVLFPALAYIRKFRVFGIQLALMMMFWGATAMLLAVGRAGSSIEQAMEPEPRYQTVALLFWCSVGLLLLGSAFLAPGRMRYGFLAAQVCLLVIFVRGAATASQPIGKAREHGFALRAAAACLLTGVHDLAQLKRACTIVDIVPRAARYLKANHLSVFAGTVPSELGKPLEDVFPVTSSGDCTGVLEAVAPIVEPSGPGLRVTGWAWDVKHQRSPSAIVVTTNGIITGVGAVGGWRPDVAAMQSGISSSYAGYVAYLPELEGISVVNLYAILRGRPPTACRFAMM